MKSKYHKKYRQNLHTKIQSQFILILFMSSSFAVLLYFIVTSYIVFFYQTSADKIASGFVNQQSILIWRLYNYQDLKQKVVLIRNPHNTELLGIRKVIALEGDIIKYDDQQLFVNDQTASSIHNLQQINQEIMAFKNQAKQNTNQEIILRKNQIYVLGNDTTSIDSRIFGPIHKSFIIGVIR